jgi:fatty acid desaturase
MTNTATANVVTPIQPRNTMVKTGRNQSDFTELSQRIKNENLLQKTPGFYFKKITQISVLMILACLGVAILAPSPYALFLAPVIGILVAQFGFIAHEAAHKQVFENNKHNEKLALIMANFFVGLSYGWWDKKKHNYHHANPNTVGKDPDIKLPIFAFTVEEFHEKNKFEKVLTKRQGFLFPFLLLFTGFDLLYRSYSALFEAKTTIKNRSLEIALITIRTIAPMIFLALMFSPIIAAVFWVVQMMVFGLFMGGAFAPNHKGMPIIPRDMKVDFFRKQVLTSRDIKSNWLTDNLMGGLNFQVEHHLFPSMPRPNLKRTQEITKQYCLEKNVDYVETGLFASYGIVINYLNEVGLRNSDPFECPLVAQFRPAG